MDLQKKFFRPRIVWFVVFLPLPAVSCSVTLPCMS